MAKKESKFQKDLIDDIKEMFSGCKVMKNDEQYIQGIPDLTVCHKDKYAILEVKKYKGAPYQPNQEYYLEKFNEMSFARTVYPENKEEVLSELKDFFIYGRRKR